MSTDRGIAWRKRPDLIAKAGGAERWVIQDPVSLRYVLLNDAEYAVLSRLDGRATSADLLALLANKTLVDLCTKFQ